MDIRTDAFTFEAGLACNEKENAMKKYAKQFLIVLLVAAVLLTLSAVLRVGGAAGGLARTLKNNWQLDLPQGYEVEYRSATDDKMKEGGLRYHALLYADSAVLDDWMAWSLNKEMQTGAGIYAADEVREVLDALNVPGGERPDLKESGYYNLSDGAGNEIFLLHAQNDLRLYIVEIIR